MNLIFQPISLMNRIESALLTSSSGQPISNNPSNHPVFSPNKPALAPHFRNNRRVHDEQYSQDHLFKAQELLREVCFRYFHLFEGESTWSSFKAFEPCRCVERGYCCEIFRLGRVW